MYFDRRADHGLSDLIHLQFMSLPLRLPQRLRGREKKRLFRRTNRLLTRAAQKMLADDKALTEPRPQGSGWVVDFFSRPAPPKKQTRGLLETNGLYAHALAQ